MENPTEEKEVTPIQREKFLSRIKSKVKQSAKDYLERRKERKASKPKEPFMQKYGPDSPFRGPGRVLQLVGLDKAVTKFTRSQYSDCYSVNSELDLEFDRLITLGYYNEVTIVRDVLHQNSSKNKSYLLALRKLSKHSNLLKQL